MCLWWKFWWSHGRCPPTLRFVPTVLGWCGVKEQSQKLSRAVSSGRLDEAVYIRNIGKESSLCSEDAGAFACPGRRKAWSKTTSTLTRRGVKHSAWEVSRALVVNRGVKGCCVSWGVSWGVLGWHLYSQLFKVCWQRLLTHCFIWVCLKMVYP